MVRLGNNGPNVRWSANSVIVCLGIGPVNRPLRGGFRYGDRLADRHRGCRFGSVILSGRLGSGSGLDLVPEPQAVVGAICLSIAMVCLQSGSGGLGVRPQRSALRTSRASATSFGDIPVSNKASPSARSHYRRVRAESDLGHVCRRCSGAGTPEPTGASQRAQSPDVAERRAVMEPIDRVLRPVGHAWRLVGTPTIVGCTLGFWSPVRCDRLFAIGTVQRARRVTDGRVASTWP
jgi:hypothetical protein